MCSLKTVGKSRRVRTAMVVAAIVLAGPRALLAASWINSATTTSSLSLSSGTNPDQTDDAFGFPELDRGPMTRGNSMLVNLVGQRVSMNASGTSNLTRARLAFTGSATVNGTGQGILAEGFTSYAMGWMYVGFTLDTTSTVTISGQINYASLVDEPVLYGLAGFQLWTQDLSLNELYTDAGNFTRSYTLAPGEYYYSVWASTWLVGDAGTAGRDGQWSSSVAANLVIPDLQGGPVLPEPAAGLLLPVAAVLTLGRGRRAIDAARD